jgi:hypothetical protein
MLSSAGFIGIAGDSVTIHFLRKKASFHFNNPRNPDAESRSQKVGSLKDFEIRGVPKMELPHNDEKLSTHSTRSFAQSKNEVLA